MTEKQQQQRRFLAIGDSLTAGYYQYGLAYHPYAKHLEELFAEKNSSVIIDQKGLSGERAVPTMVRRLENILEKNAASYKCILILGGTNDIVSPLSAHDIFNQGLKVMYDTVLQCTPNTSKLVIMTVPQIALFPPGHEHERKRETLNGMIRNYANNENKQKRMCLVDLDKAIPFHTMNNTERDLIWDDGVHLTPAGYDRMATTIFDTLTKELHF